jgi:hypothetical protein
MTYWVPASTFSLLTIPLFWDLRLHLQYFFVLVYVVTSHEPCTIPFTIPLLYIQLTFPPVVIASVRFIGLPSRLP